MSLVQVAVSFPLFLFTLPAGALARSTQLTVDRTATACSWPGQDAKIAALSEQSERETGEGSASPGVDASSPEKSFAASIG